MKIKAKVVQVLPAQTGTSQAGKQWKKVGVVANYREGEYEKTVCFTTMGGTADVAEGLKEGQTADFSYNIESREYNSKWYTDVKAWKIDVDGASQTPAPAPAQEQSNDNDLPF